MLAFTRNAITAKGESAGGSTGILRLTGVAVGGALVAFLAVLNETISASGETTCSGAFAQIIVAVALVALFDSDVYQAISADVEDARRCACSVVVVRISQVAGLIAFNDAVPAQCTIGVHTIPGTAIPANGIAIVTELIAG